MLIVSVNVTYNIDFQKNKGIIMNETSIENVNEWSNELLILTKNHASYEEYNGDRYIQVIEMGNNSKDKKVIQTLMDCFQYEISDVIDQYILGTLSTINYKLYYETLFELIPKILKDNNSDVAVLLLCICNGEKFTLEQWNGIEKLSKKYLNNTIMQKLLKLMERNQYFTLESEDYPYPQFYQLFQKLLKEKSEE